MTREKIDPKMPWWHWRELIQANNRFGDWVTKVTNGKITRRGLFLIIAIIVAIAAIIPYLSWRYQ